MEKQSHTPGPWAVGTIHDRQQRGGEIVETIKIEVCATDKDFESDSLTVGPPRICSLWGNGPDWNNEVPLANARVIAAAPELLALAKRALPILQHAINRDPVGLWSDAAIKLEHDALAAIAKAGGRA